ncbi:MAG: ABC transporter permease, partial [Planctomycetota bacterium]
MRRSTLQRTIRLGISSLLLHKLRSFLTTLGVLFGVASVIAMLAVGEGASAEAQEEIKKLGSRNVILRSVEPPVQGDEDAEVRVQSYGLTRDDFDRIAETFELVQRAVPVLQTPAEVRQSEFVCRPRVLCTTPEYRDVTQRTLFSGRFLTELDESSRSLTCVLGYEVARFLFPFESAIGKRVKIDQHYMEVVGVLGSRLPVGSVRTDPSTEAGGEVFVPLSTGRAYFGERQTEIRSGSMDIEEVQLHEIVIEVGRGPGAAEVDGDVELVAEAARHMLSSAHDDKDYEVIVPLELLAQARATKRIFNIVLGSIAGISLLVGGIGIMNVMLATVTERTREIGIRRALGAKRKHIVTQFLVETMVLSGAGGIVGVGVGLFIPWVVERFADLETIVTPAAPILA